MKFIALTDILFYLSSTIMMLSAIMVACSRNAVRAVLFLVLSFFSAAVLWLLLQAEFLAVTLVVVYVGAVMVLFLFVVMMLDIEVDAKQKKFTTYMPIGLGIAAVILIQMILVIINMDEIKLLANPQSRLEQVNNIASIGRILYTEYVYAFELAAVILFVAIVAAITLTFRGRKENTKGQNITEQVQVKAEDRVRLVNMAVERKSS